MYPEHEKLDTEKLKIIDDLVGWLKARGYSICKIDKVGFYNGEIEHAKWNDLRVEFFSTSQEALEKERIVMLKQYQ